MAALKQRLTGRIQVERDGALIEKGIDPDVGTLRIDAGSLVPCGNKFIADRIFDPEGPESPDWGRGHRRALTFTLIVCVGVNQSGQANAYAA